MHIRSFLFLILTLLVSCNASEDNRDKVSVAVAANMMTVINPLKNAFVDRYHIDVEVSSASSGVLTSQINNGAPFDVFLSANMDYAQRVYDANYAKKLPEIYSKGQLVFWNFTDEGEGANLESLSSDNVHLIGIANPETSPFGAAAKELLQRDSLWWKLEDKFVFGENISQINTYIKTQSVDVGLTSLSGIKFQEKATGVIGVPGSFSLADPALYTPIEQAIVILKHGEIENKKNTQLFYDFMFSADARRILLDYGYVVN